MAEGKTRPDEMKNYPPTIHHAAHCETAGAHPGICNTGATVGLSARKPSPEMCALTGEGSGRKGDREEWGKSVSLTRRCGQQKMLIERRKKEGSKTSANR